MLNRAKVAVTIDGDLLLDVDEWVVAGEFPNRSRAFEAGLERLRVDRQRRQTLLTMLELIDPEEEKALAEEWLDEEVSWLE